MRSRTQVPKKWLQQQLVDLVKSMEAGVSVNSDDRTCADGEVGVLKTSCVYSGVFRANEHKAVLAEEAARVRAHVKGDHIIVSRMNTPDLVGASGYVETTHRNLFLPDRLWQIRTKSNIDPRWLAFVLGSPRYRALLRAIATGTSQSMKNISKDALLHLPVLTPPPFEQRRIAEILGAWAKSIEKIEHLIALKETQLDYLRFDLVSWSRWPKRPIGTVICSVSRPEPTPKAAYRALGVRSHGKGTFQRNIERPDEIDMDTVYGVGARDLIVNITFAWEGAIALAKEEDVGCYVSHRFPTFEVNESLINREFLGYAVRSRQFFHCLGIASPGGAGRNRVLSKRDFLKIEIPFPPKDDQDRIAAILGTADRELMLLKAEKAALNLQKRGLMQKLLTGEWRVPLHDRDAEETVTREVGEAAE